jgi:hypothetical protein
MHKEVVAIIKVNQNILGAPVQTQNLPALQPGHKINRKRKTKTGSANFNASNGAPEENGD